MGNLLKTLPLKLGPKIEIVHYKATMKKIYIPNLQYISGLKFMDHVKEQQRKMSK